MDCIGCENTEVRISQHHKLFDMECDVSYKFIGQMHHYCMIMSLLNLKFLSFWPQTYLWCFSLSQNIHCAFPTSGRFHS